MCVVRVRRPPPRAAIFFTSALSGRLRYVWEVGVGWWRSLLPAGFLATQSSLTIRCCAGVGTMSKSQDMVPVLRC